MHAALTKHTRRLEAMAVQLLRMDFDGAQGFWDFQVALLELQRDIQSRVRESRRDPDAVGDPSEWERVKWHARRLGDAFAWLVLGTSRQAIYPLADNTRVPVPDDDTGSRGVLAIAQHLSFEGWGFPVLHDVTDILRIGDVTFVRPELGIDGLRTVEVKTSVVESVIEDDGRARQKLSVTVVHHTAPDLDDAALLPVERTTITRPAGRRPHDRLLRSPRTRRQLDRMSGANVRQTAPDNEVFHVRGEPWLSISVEAHSADWRAVRRLIRRARRDGYASETVEGALMYIALYGEDGITPEYLERTPLAADVAGSSILASTKPERNSIVLHTNPAPDRRSAALSLPFYLYEIPRRAVLDMLWGRLLLVVLVNPGKLADLLEAAGFEVTSRGDATADHPDSLVVTAEVELPDGTRGMVELNNIEHSIPELVHEFRPPSHLVAIAVEMRERAAASWAAVSRPPDAAASASGTADVP